MEFQDLRRLEFRYMTVQLNRLNWCKFVDESNPVASALMARMKIRRSIPAPAGLQLQLHRLPDRHTYYTNSRYTPRW